MNTTAPNNNEEPLEEFFPKSHADFAFVNPSRSERDTAEDESEPRVHGRLVSPGNERTSRRGFLAALASTMMIPEEIAQAAFDTDMLGSSRDAYQSPRPHSHDVLGPPIARPRVLVYYDPAMQCPPCDLLKAEAHLFDLDFKWVEAPQSMRALPVLYWKDRKGRWAKPLVGYTGRAAFVRAWDDSMSILIAPARIAKQRIVVRRPVAPRRAILNNYIPRWVGWSGTLYNHLRYDHGVNPAGMSMDEMERYHDALHDGRLSMPARASARPILCRRRLLVRRNRGCPGGACPR